MDIKGYKVIETLLYNKMHFWVKIDGEIATVGITDYGQKQLGDISLVSLNEKAGMVKQVQFKGSDPSSDPIDGMSVESAKAVQDLYSPLSGNVIEVNKKLEDTPEKINQDCYGAGWIFKVKGSNLAAEKASLMKAQAYGEFLKTLD
jgi:glycine cleavage system H protein